MREASVFGGDEMADEGEGVLQLRNNGVLVVFMRVMITCRDVGTTHADAVECQGKDVTALSGSDCKLTIEN